MSSSQDPPNDGPPEDNHNTDGPPGYDPAEAVPKPKKPWRKVPLRLFGQNAPQPTPADLPGIKPSRTDTFPRYDDGPRTRSESARQARQRITRARLEMGLRLRLEITPPQRIPGETEASYNQRKENNERLARDHENQHRARITDGNPLYDVVYAEDWITQERQRRQYNDQQRSLAFQYRENYNAANRRVLPQAVEVNNYDWGDEYFMPALYPDIGAETIESQFPTRIDGPPGQSIPYGVHPGTDTPAGGEESPFSSRFIPGPRCERCKRKKVKCDKRRRNCRRCINDKAVEECIYQDEEFDAINKNHLSGPTCDYCRRMHFRCDGQRPCKSCRDAGISAECLVEVDGGGQGGQSSALPRGNGTLPTSTASGPQCDALYLSMQTAASGRTEGLPIPPIGDIGFDSGFQPTPSGGSDAGTPAPPRGRRRRGPASEFNKRDEIPAEGQRTDPPTNRCQRCQKRKLKCDVRRIGYPCTPCKAARKGDGCVNGKWSIVRNRVSKNPLSQVSDPGNTGNDANDPEHQFWADATSVPDTAGLAPPRRGPDIGRPINLADRARSRSPLSDKQCQECSNTGIHCPTPSENWPCARCAALNLRCVEVETELPYDAGFNPRNDSYDVEEEEEDIYGASPPRRGRQDEQIGQTSPPLDYIDPSMLDPRLFQQDSAPTSQPRGFGNLLQPPTSSTPVRSVGNSGDQFMAGPPRDMNPPVDPYAWVPRSGEPVSNEDFAQFSDVPNVLRTQSQNPVGFSGSSQEQKPIPSQETRNACEGWPEVNLNDTFQASDDMEIDTETRIQHWGRNSKSSDQYNAKDIDMLQPPNPRGPNQNQDSPPIQTQSYQVGVAFLPETIDLRWDGYQPAIRPPNETLPFSKSGMTYNRPQPKSENNGFAVTNICTEMANPYSQIKPNKTNQCGNEFAKECDVPDHAKAFYTCEPCHSIQNVNCENTEFMLRRRIRAFACGKCAGIVKAQKDRGMQVYTNECACTKTLRAGWYCHSHRYEMVNALMAQITENDTLLMEIGGGREFCVGCFEGTANAQSGVWGCKCCRRWVVNGGGSG